MYLKETDMPAELTAGINGFGRFGLHLLKYWLDRADTTKFSVGFINDDTLTLN